MKTVNILLLIMVSCNLNFAQDQVVLTKSDCLDIVRRHHPISYQSDLLIKKASANSLAAKGEFDPKVSSNFNQKKYDGKNYFTNLSSKLVVPTWFGVDLVGGFDHNDGVFLNNSDVLPQRGIWNAGFSIPLGNGLLFDKRRAAVKKAKIYNKEAKAERRRMLNELILDTETAYLEWQVNHARYEIAVNGVNLAEERFQSMKMSYEGGDKAAVDTLEAFIYFQNRTIALIEIEQLLENSRLNMQNFLWNEGYIPLDIEIFVEPEPIDIKHHESIVDSFHIIKQDVIDRHPDLLIYQYKIEEIEIDQRLNRESRKPNIKLQVSPLVGTTTESLYRSYDIQDYKIGASFSYPLLTRKARGKGKLNQLIAKETQYNFSLKKQDIILKLDVYRNNDIAIRNQVAKLEPTIINYRILLDAENQKFDLGESSVFLVNSREVKYLESEIKLIETKSKLIRYRLLYLYSTGQLITE